MLNVLVTLFTIHRLYQEKLEELDDKIQKVTEGNAPEYLHPQKELQRTLSQRLVTAEAHRNSKVRGKGTIQVVGKGENCGKQI